MQTTQVRGWPGFFLEGKKITLGFAPSIGGRLISLTYEGEELLFVQEERAGQQFHFSSSTDLREEKKRIGFPLFGGDKTWVSPQSAWWEATPPLELDAAPYSYTLGEQQIVMQSSTCHETGLKLDRSYQIEADDSILLIEQMTNMSDQTVKRGLWNVTQVLRPFSVFFPTDHFKPYPEEGDSVAKEKEVIEGQTIHCKQPIHFKYGTTPKEGYLIAYREKEGETLIWERQFHLTSGANYAHGVACEVYNSPTYPYLEIEVHAPFQPIEPGQTISYHQRWMLRTVKGVPNQF